MLRHSVNALLLLAACEGLRYPHYEQVFRDPASYDMLYNSGSGSINETWYFSRSVNLTALILPSQVVTYCHAANETAGSWGKSVYEEDLEVRVYERSQARGPSALVAVGSFRGNATSGEELRVPLAAVVYAQQVPYSGLQPPPQPLTVAAYNATSGRGPNYTVSVSFGAAAGLYPWYLRRDLADLSPLADLHSEQGLLIGLAFVLV